MTLKTIMATGNACYKSGTKHTVKGILVHSTGADNPNLSRYVQPIGYSPADALLGVNKYKNDWCNNAKPGGRAVCVHAFIGKLTDGSVATYQILPWDMKGWHSGSGSKGSAANANNNGYVGFEICEDALTDKTYFEKAYTEAVELCAMLCKQYGIKPEKPTLICHSEGHALGIASNHADVMHWWPKHGKSMDTFRADVAKLLNAVESPTPPTSSKTPIMGKSECTAEQLNAYAKSKNANAPEYGAIFIDEGKAEGVRGDIAFCQSCLETGFFKFGGDVLAEQNNFCGLGAVGGGAKGASFATPRDGIRAQIQHLKAYASKDALVNPCIDPRFSLVTRGVAPNWEDMNGRWAVPGNGYGENIVGLWKGAKGTATDTTPAVPPERPSTATPYLVKITADVLNSRAGAGTNCPINGTVKKGEVYTIVDEANGIGASKWGRLKSGAGWISLDYVIKV